jgi:formamidopyrimidine-DNA glycosylase
VPELPEAETIAAELRSQIEGASIAGVEVVHPDVLEESPETLAQGLTGRTIRQVTRRGKNVVLVLDDDARLVVNLGMSGRLLHRRIRDPDPPPTHPAVRFRLEGENRDSATDPGVLVYHDIRRFGRLRLLDRQGYGTWSRSLGPEPLSRAFTARRLLRDLARSVSPIRSWLLDQRRIAGVGNIYANEALHRAGIHPVTSAARIPADRIPRLHRSLRRVLREAVRSRGTTLRDYRTAGGDEGSYAVRLRVYGRAGETCARCGAVIRRIVFGARSAFLCPRCQPEPPEKSES